MEDINRMRISEVEMRTAIGAIYAYLKDTFIGGRKQVILADATGRKIAMFKLEKLPAPRRVIKPIVIRYDITESPSGPEVINTIENKKVGSGKRIRLIDVVDTMLDIESVVKSAVSIGAPVEEAYYLGGLIMYPIFTPNRNGGVTLHFEYCTDEEITLSLKDDRMF